MAEGSPSELGGIAPERRLRDEGFIDVRRVREIWSEHVSGRRNRETQLWEILMFQAWLEAQPAADLLAGPGTTGSVYLEAGSG